MYTHYMLTHIGDKITAKIDGSIANTNTWYDADKPLVIEKKDDDVYAVPFDFIRYKLKRNDVESSESVITVNFPPDYNTNPSARDLVFSLNVGDSVFLTDELELNNTFDRIIFTNIEDDLLEIDDLPVRQNRYYYSYDLKRMKYKHNVGVGEPYSVVKYKLSNGKIDSEEAELIFNVVGEPAYIDDVSENQEFNSTEINEEKLVFIYPILKEFTIKNLPKNRKFKISVKTNLSGIERVFNDEEEEVSSRVFFLENTIKENGVEEFEFDTLEGQVYFPVFVEKLSIGGQTISGTIDFEIIEVDGSKDKFDKSKSKVNIKI